MDPALLKPEFGLPGGAVMKKEYQTVRQGRKKSPGNLIIFVRSIDIRRKFEGTEIFAKGDAYQSEVLIGDMIVVATDRDLLGGEEEVD